MTEIALEEPPKPSDVLVVDGTAYTAAEIAKMATDLKQMAIFIESIIDELRHERIVVRHFETETERALRLVVDATASMGFRSKGAPGASGTDPARRPDDPGQRGENEPGPRGRETTRHRSENRNAPTARICSRPDSSTSY